MKNNILKTLFAFTLVVFFFSSCSKEPIVVVDNNTGFNGGISASNGCGEISGNYTIKDSKLSAHIIVSNINEADTAYLYFDGALLLEVVGAQTKENDFNKVVSQGEHSFMLENRCGSCSYSFNVSTN